VPRVIPIASVAHRAAPVPISRRRKASASLRNCTFSGDQKHSADLAEVVEWTRDRDGCSNDGLHAVYAVEAMPPRFEKGIGRLLSGPWHAADAQQFQFPGNTDPSRYTTFSNIVHDTEPGVASKVNFSMISITVL
jgi:hypothetical protein